MRGHAILCGYGRIGRAVAAELERNGEDYVIIDDSVEVVETLRDAGKNVILGNATTDEALIAAGIYSAGRLVAALNADNDNIVTVLSARQLNSELTIASRIVHAEAEQKLHRAGANEVISPYDFGGRRIALALLRPNVDKFLREVIFDEGRGAEIDEVPVFAGSDLAGKSLGEIGLRLRFGATVLALRHCSDNNYKQHAGFELNPGPDTILRAGDVLIVVGNAEQLSQLHQALNV